MNLFQSHIPSIAASVVVGGVVIASGGSMLQSGVAAIATGASGYATSALVIQKIESQRDRLKRDVEQQKRALPFGTNLEYLQKQQELLQQGVADLKQQESELQERVRLVQQDLPNLEELEQRQQKIGELKTQISTGKGQLKAIADQIADREKQRDGLQEVTAQFLQKQEAVKMLTEQIRELNQKTAELELFRSTYDALRTDAENLAAKEQHLKSELPRLEQERDRILTEIGTMESRAQQVDALRVQIENSEAVLRAKRSELMSLIRQIEQLTSEKNQLEVEIDLKKKEIRQQEIKLREIHAEIRKAKENLEEVASGVKQAFQSLEEPIEIEAVQVRSFASEIVFLSAFKQYLTSKGLVFPDRIINAFHTSLKVQDISALVILAGISGTGKSELPQAYAEFVGAPLVMLPVQPRWDSPQDLQGFYNYIEKKYKPTPLMRHLYQHQHQNNLKGRMVLVLLDEMNLAKVEYYFSDFLSKLETRRNKKTYLELDAGSLPLTNEQKQIVIPEEFLFVGTMNEDETTQSLSDKVLDRANVLTFGRPAALTLGGGKQTKPPIPKEYLPWDAFQGWTKDPNGSPVLTEKVQKYVDRANDIMEALGRPFAHRVYQAFAKYVVNYPNAEHDDAIANQAIADQFGQKLLPKLRGVIVEESKVEKQLNDLENLLSELGNE
ncbi:MAG: AAA family ATPase [Pseudanabaena sp. CAN_BIN31]|nr:AAA family ATPase [Pseudanabaena sp. CAN_BIN31]